jgi:hypothetical protein
MPMNIYSILDAAGNDCPGENIINELFNFHK